ncbi:MAG: hypothetical protein K6E75_01760 [Lachnospiraceae bacterium]|nr:hypothetical protein [Lachnospiraceae bacterium]
MIEKISILAQLSLTEEEKILAGEDMARMLDFFALLSAWEEKEQDPVESTDVRNGGREAVPGDSTVGAEETAGRIETTKTEITKITGNILRRDEVTNEEAGEELMANAPLQKNGMFVVPLSISAGYEEETGDGEN